MVTQAQNAVKEIRDAEWTCFPSAGRSVLQMWLLSGMLLHSDCVSCKPKAPCPSRKQPAEQEALASPQPLPYFCKKNILHHKPFDEEREREPLMKYANLGKPGSYEREY